MHPDTWSDDFLSFPHQPHWCWLLYILLFVVHYQIVKTQVLDGFIFNLFKHIHSPISSRDFSKFLIGSNSFIIGVKSTYKLWSSVKPLSKIWSRFLILFVYVIWTKVLYNRTYIIFSWQAFTAYRSASSGLMENVLTFDIIFKILYFIIFFLIYSILFLI